MPRMQAQEVRDIITPGLDKLDAMAIDADALDQIVMLAQGLPHYAHLLGLHSARVALDSHSMVVSSLVVSEAVKNAIQDTHTSHA